MLEFYDDLDIETPEDMFESIWYKINEFEKNYGKVDLLMEKIRHNVAPISKEEEEINIRLAKELEKYDIDLISDDFIKKLEKELFNSEDIG